MTDTMPSAGDVRVTEPSSDGAEAETQLRRIFEDILGLSGDRLDPDTPFVELGAESLALMRASQLITERLGVSVPFRELLGPLNTIRALSGRIGAAPADRPAPVREVPSELPRPTPPAPPPPAAVASSVVAEDRPVAPQDPPKATSGPAEDVPGDGLIASLVGRQIELMQQQLSVLRRVPLPSNASVPRDPSPPATNGRAVLRWGGRGATLIAPDGTEHLDLDMGSGACLYGHGPDFVMEALAAEVAHGAPLQTADGSQPRAAVLAQEVLGVERVLLVGSFATALELSLSVARSATGRSRTVVLGPSGSDAERITAVGPSTELEIWPVEAALKLPDDDWADIAAVVVDPVLFHDGSTSAGDSPQRVQESVRRGGGIVILDERRTALRAHPGGAAKLLGLTPDMALLGASIAGGLPLGGLAGSDDLVALAQRATPEPPHGLSSAAAEAVLARVRQDSPDLQSTLAQRAHRAAADLKGWADAEDLPLEVRAFASLILLRAEAEAMAALRSALRSSHVVVGPDLSWHLSTAHTTADLDRAGTSLRAAAARVFGDRSAAG
ncbi:MAG TPA: phosphopantetheine-binding protein [Solirubrobacteraceae bacterium]|jgi:glutamate-1-semialdehyde aminotransferase/acyl carrier protein